MSTSLSIILIIITLLIGVGAGALLHKLLGRGSNYYRQMLAERDREIDQMHTHMHQHLSQVTDMAEQLHTQSQQLNQLLARETQLLDSDIELKRRVRLLNGQSAMTEEEEEAALSLHAPRDYAEEVDTSPLSSASDARQNDDPQPPRY
ncbi:ZapG family protein [Zymobacter sp. IVIA_12111.31 C1]|uniref:ZapG family protein n=1 Tax=Zymobacter sp. IVIA_12111.31 C1 TaxID=3394854 RepID=UPI0039C25AD7